MRLARLVYVALALGLSSLGGCTIYVVSQLSGLGSDGATNPSETGSSSDCFGLALNQCGQCIEQQCERASATPPVSLKSVCTLDPNGVVIPTVQGCVQNPDIQNYMCSDMFQEGGTYAPTITSAGAADNNLRKCITDNCSAQCSECNVPVPGCSSGSVSLVEAGTCGQCLDQAMNRPGGACETLINTDSCNESPSADPTQNAISACAANNTVCGSGMCSGLMMPDPNLTDASYALMTCLWGACRGSCPQQ